MVSSLLAGIRFPSLINEGLDARGTDPNENADPPQKPGRKLIGMPAGFISEWWPASNRNGGRLHVGIPGRNKSESAVTSQIPVEHWHEIIGDPTLGDAILDRLVHNANRLQLTGESMRKQNARNQTLDANSTPEPITMSVKAAAHDRAKYLLTIV
jgi:hypothetical protein